MSEFEQIDAIKPPDSLTSPDLVAADERGNLDIERLKHQQAQFQSELGIVGKIFGGRQEKAGNISAVVLFLCFIALAVAWIAEVGLHVYFATQKIDPPSMPFDKVVAGTISVITLVLGYLFGNSSHK